jgi:hypothetical protein
VRHTLFVTASEAHTIVTASAAHTIVTASEASTGTTSAVAKAHKTPHIAIGGYGRTTRFQVQCSLHGQACARGCTLCLAAMWSATNTGVTAVYHQPPPPPQCPDERPTPPPPPHFVAYGCPWLCDHIPGAGGTMWFRSTAVNRHPMPRLPGCGTAGEMMRHRPDVRTQHGALRDGADAARGPCHPPTAPSTSTLHSCNHGWGGWPQDRGVHRRSHVHPRGAGKNAQRSNQLQAHCGDTGHTGVAPSGSAMR